MKNKYNSDTLGDMTKNKFRTPNEMHPEREEKVPVSTRVRASTREFLEKEAKKNNLSLALLLGNIIEDYGQWLASLKNGKS